MRGTRAAWWMSLVVLAVSMAACRPPPEPNTDVDQGWPGATAQRWYHIDQGAALFPYEWLLALEQPAADERFAAPANLARFGFIADPVQSQSNPDGLPVGFARTRLDLDFGVHRCWRGDWVGFTCAACHTGAITYRGTTLRIEGGPAQSDIEAFEHALSTALDAMRADSDKAQQFAFQVIKAVGDLDPADLGTSLQCFGRERAARAQASTANASDASTPAGFGRLDALGHGANRLLAQTADPGANDRPTTAPVSFPPLWDTPSFDRVLYDNGFRQPLAYSVFQALGAGAPVDLQALGRAELVHQVQVDNLVTIQQWLQDLRSPRWPDTVLGQIDPGLAARGEAIYQAECAGCHAIVDRTAPRPPGTTLTNPTVPVAQIGTDPNRATDVATREVVFGDTAQPLAAWIKELADQIIGPYAAVPDGALRMAAINGDRPNEIRMSQAYRARPLNGVWATAPYLHNGSVPDMVALLTPADARPNTFYVGSRELDPARLGFAWQSPAPGRFEFDTSLPGNANTGHDYGTDLSDEDRSTLVEYLKTL